MNILLLDEQQVSGEQVELTTTQRTHIKTVLKKSPAEQVRIGIRDGMVGIAIVNRLADNTQHHLTIVKETLQPPPPKVKLHIFCALPRPPVLSRLLSALTSMGIASIHLIHTTKVQKSYWQSPRLQEEKVQNAIDAGLIQSRDTISPRISLKMSLTDVLAFANKNNISLLYGHPATKNISRVRDTKTYGLIIGPEGGLTHDECQQLDMAGARHISVGERPLRCETAAIALSSLIMAQICP